jgi:hypothetical protein
METAKLIDMGKLASGDVVAWLMDGSTVKSWATLFNGPNQEWRLPRS